MLNRFDTPVDVMSVMFKTPPDQMHVFTPEEIERYKLNRRSGEPAEHLVDSTATIATKADRSPNGTSSSSSESTTSSEPALPSAVAQPQANPSPIEEFTKQPNRVAVYAGLDLFGDDLSTIRVTGAGECAQNCLLMNGQCKAFTFNTNPRIKRGPNCFLKSSAGRADGNSVAFSGRFLSGAEADPPAFTLGTIDPQSALFDDVDLPGGDLSRYPIKAAKTPLDCRLACVDDRRCVAFTYIRAKKECWLKGTIGSPAFGKGMISGIKKFQSFAPTKIISLN